jgi:hypothetical protein
MQRLIVLCGLLGGCAAVSPVVVVDEQYRAIERGELDVWARGFAPDALLIGTDAGEVYVGREAILEHVAKGASARMRADVKRSYRSTRRHLGTAPDGKSAWIADEIDYRVTSPEGSKTYLFRMTSLLAEVDGAWAILASCYSVAVPDEEAFAKPPVVSAPVPDVVGTGAEPIASIVRAAATDHFPGLFSNRADVFLYGTSPAERVEGGAAVLKFTGQGLPGRIRVERTGGIAAGLAPSGNTGWVAYTAILTVPNGMALPVRVFAVLIEEGSSWRKVQEHVSLAVPD